MPTVRECLALLTNLDRFKVVIKKKFNIGGITKHDFKFTNTTVTQQLRECLDQEVKAILTDQDETTKKITNVFVIEQDQDLIDKILELEDEHYEQHGLYQIRKRS
jgi:hypothetical protein